tara:strand:- start:263 stop:1123 length:861 start_codon:yes stop_codon:yes gene_type:complete
MKTPTLLLLALSLTLQLSQAETASEIATKHDREKIAAIGAYLQANPDAADKDLALSILVDAHLSMGESAPVPDLLSQRYELQSKGPDANLQLMIGEIARPFIESSIVSNQRDKAKAFIAQVKSDFADSPQIAQLTQFLDQLAANLYLPGVGDTMEFAFTDLKENEVDLAAMKGKVILVDFWATWCPPCVAEMPNVIATYNELHDKGFEVIGISLDEDKAALESFIEENGMPWAQYFDGKGWENELAQRYGIGSVPATFLIGKDGKVAASNLRGSQLEEAVAAELAK